MLINLSLQIGNLIAIDDAHPSLPDIKAAPLIDLITAPLEPTVPLDPILVPDVQVLNEGSSESAVIESTIGESQTVPMFVDDEAFILTAETARTGSVIEKQEAVSNASTDEPSVQIAMKLNVSVEGEHQDASMISSTDEPSARVGVKVTISAEEEKRAVSNPMKENGEEDNRNTVEVAETNEEKPVSPLLIETDVASEPSATSEPILPDEEEPASILKEETESGPAVTDLIPTGNETGDGRELSIPAQPVQEAATVGDGDLVVTHTEFTNVPDIEEERPTVCFEPFENSKQEIVKDDTTSDIIEPANLNGVEEKSLSGRGEVAELMGENPAFVGAGSSDVKGGAVNDPVVVPPVLLTPLHFAAPAAKVVQSGSVSSVTEKQLKMELIVKEERTITIESHFE